MDKWRKCSFQVVFSVTTRVIVLWIWKCSRTSYSRHLTHLNIHPSSARFKWKFAEIHAVMNMTHMVSFLVIYMTHTVWLIMYQSRKWLLFSRCDPRIQEIFRLNISDALENFNLHSSIELHVERTTQNVDSSSCDTLVTIMWQQESSKMTLLTCVQWERRDLGKGKLV